MVDDTTRFDRFGWDDAAAAVVFGVSAAKSARYVISLKYNQNHVSSGPTGGQFTNSDGLVNSILPAGAANLPAGALQPYNTWKDLRSNADAALAELDGHINNLAAEMGIRTDVHSGDITGELTTNNEMFAFTGIKAEARSREKVASDYNNNWARLKDVVRGGISVNTVAQVKQVVEGLYARGLGFVEPPKNRFANPTQAGYRDLLGVTRLSNGMLAEIQVQLKPITVAKNEGHTYYEESRSIQAKYPGDATPSARWTASDTSAFNQSMADQNKLYDSAWRKALGRATKVAKAVDDIIASQQVIIENDDAIFRGSAVSFPTEVWDVDGQKWMAYTGSTPKPVEWGNVISMDQAKVYMEMPVESMKQEMHPGAIRTDQWVTIKKFDNDKQIVYGEVYAPMVLDTYGEFMTAEDIEIMAHRFMQLDLGSVIDTQHDTLANGAYPVESFIARPNDPDYAEGAWVLGVKIPDAGLWSRAKSGELNGFSFQCLVKPTDVDVEYDTIRDYVGATELFDTHDHTFFAELNEIGNVIGGRTSKATDGHYHEITRASVTDTAGGHSHRFFL